MGSCALQTPNLLDHQIWCLVLHRRALSTCPSKRLHVRATQQPCCEEDPIQVKLWQPLSTKQGCCTPMKNVECQSNAFIVANVHRRATTRGHRFSSFLSTEAAPKRSFRSVFSIFTSGKHRLYCWNDVTDTNARVSTSPRTGTPSIQSEVT